MKKSLYFSILSVLFLFISNVVQGAIPSQERAALIALYNSTNGDSWTNNSGWKTPPLDTDGFAMPGTEGGWYGITVLSDYVTQINLFGNLLTGSLPTELGNLGNLERLYLGLNRLTGNIPTELGNLANLQILSLLANQLTGNIPPQLGNLVNLIELSMGGNQFSGGIPPEFGNLINLQRLSMENTQISGSIPAELGNLTNLTNLHLTNNQLTGSIPSQFGNLGNLKYLCLEMNQLTGSIPSQLGNLSKLNYLYLENNQLSGSIPPELGNIGRALLEFRLYNNQLSGNIPAELGNLTSLQSFALHNNQLSGSIPAELGNITELQSIILSNNQFSGSIPSSLGNFSALESLALSNNQLSGTIPSTLGNIGNLIYLELDSNQLSGEIPANLTNLSQIQSLKIGYNCLYATDPDLITWLNTHDPDWASTQTNCGPAPTITVTSPNGSENWLLGAPHDITWTSSGTVGNVKIEYSSDNGSNWNEITADTENDGIYSWTLPNTSSANYLVRVSETDGDPTDVSDGVFTLSEGISGIVTDSLGNGIANVAVSVWHLNRYGIAGGTTGANGYYEISGIAPGNYKVVFDAQNAGNYVQQWFDNGSRFESADIVSINPGSATANINAQLANGGTVSGRVTDVNGNGITNVNVQIMDISGNTYAQTNTGVDGYYTVQGSAPGGCRVFFNGPSAGNYIPEYYNNKNAWQALNSDVVSVTAGQTTGNIDAQLAGGGSISGRVTDGSSNGIPGVAVNILELTGRGISGANTDADGYYTAVAIPTGNYRVYFDGTGTGNYVPEYYNNKNSWEPQTADTVSVTAGQTASGINVQLDEGAIITGRVTDESGNGIDSVSVQIKRTDNYTIIWTGTDGSGNYTARGVPAGSWKVLFQASAYTNYISEFYNDKMSLESADLINVTAGQPVPNIDAQLANGGSISGRVTDISGNGVPGVSISVFDIVNNMWLNRSGPVNTDENGYYTYSGIPAGNHKVSFDTYNVLFYRQEYYNDKQGFEYADTVSVTANQDTPNIDAQLAPAGTISGKVTDENGNPIPNVWVSVYDLNNNHIGSQNTDAQGDYVIPYGLVAGSYKLHFNGGSNGLNYISEWYNDKDSFTNASEVVVVNNQITTGIDAQLAEGGIITGRVTDENGNGIANAAVNIQDTYGSNITGVGTDANGYYSVYGLPTGNWKVYFNATNVGNYLPQYYNNKDGWNPQLADSVSVTCGQTVTGINAQLLPGGVISGRVTDLNGNGIANASVEIMEISNYYTIQWLNTDAEGYYTARGLPAGTWKIRFDATNAGNYVPEFYNDKFKYRDADTVTVAIGQTVGNIDAQLAAGGIISGRVTDGAGNGVSNTSIQVRDTSNYTFIWSSTDNNGYYNVQGVPAGNWRVFFQPPQSTNLISEYYSDKYQQNSADLVNVVTGQTTANINAQLETGGTITGRVTDMAGNGVANIYITVQDAVNNNWVPGRATTDGNGYYTFNGIPTGNYKVTFDTYNYLFLNQEYYNDKFTWETADSVSITAGQTVTGIDAQLAAGGSISGRVTDENGNGIANVWVAIYNSNNGTSSVNGTFTDLTGNYVIHYGLPAGTYKVYFDAHNRNLNYIPEWYNNQGSFVNAGTVMVATGQVTTGIDAQLATGGTISGRVTDESGNSIANVNVQIRYPSGQSIAWVSTGADGNYTVVGIPTGNWLVFFNTVNAGNFQSEYYNNKEPWQPQLADMISVATGQTVTGINAQLLSGGTISGRVTDPNGNGIPNAGVEVMESTNYHTIIWLNADAGGYYTARGIPAGTWKIRFDATNVGNYVPEFYNDKFSHQLADTVAVSIGQTVENINAQLAEGGIITGRATDSSGNGISNVSIQIRDTTNYTFIWTGTDGSGYYTARGVPAGNWRVFFQPQQSSNLISEYYNDKLQQNSADLVSVTAGQTTANIDAQLAAGGSITGRVTDMAGNGVANIYVSMCDTSNNNWLPGQMSTDSGGYYTFNGIPTGNYVVRFDTYDNLFFIQEYYNDKPSQQTADSVSVTAGQTVTGINAQLAYGGSISGQVTDENGNGIANVWVAIFNSNNANNTVNGAFTDMSGNYVVHYGLPAGTYKVYFDAHNRNLNYISKWYNNKISFIAADPVVVTTGQITTDINAQLTGGGIISGHVTDELGNGIYNVNVQVRDTNNNYLLGVNTDSSGNYTIYGVESGNYVIYFETNNAGNYVREWFNNKTSFAAADRINVTSGQTTANIDAQLAAGGTLSGHVTDEGGNGIRNVRVRLYDLNNLQVMSILTDINGNYTLMRIFPADYRVRFDTSSVNGNFISEYYNDKVTIGYGDLVTVTAGQTSTANAVLSPGGIITGHITDTNGNGIANVRIVVRGAFSNTNYSNNKYTDGSGNFIVQGLPAGSYKVLFNTDETDNSYISEWYNNKEDFLTAGILTVTPGQTISGVDAVLASGGTITGHITDASTGYPIPEIEIYALDLNKNVTGCYAFTDENGNYALKGLPTGNFKINFNSYYYNEYYNGNYNDQWHNNKTTYQSADLVAITAGQTKTGFNAALTANGGIIRGRVTNENGDGVPNVDVLVTAEWMEFSGWEAFTNNEGYYQVSGIPNGSYHVLFLTNTAQGNYLDEAFDNKVLNGSPTIEADWVNVTEGQVVENIDAVLSIGGYVTGRVTDQNGNPIQNVRVRLYETSTGNYFARHSALTDYYGNYTVLRVRPGQLKAYFSSYEAAGGNYKAEFYNDKTTMTSGDSFTVTATQTTSGIDAVLVGGGGTISGYVRDKNGAVIKNATVQLTDKNGPNSSLGQVSCNVNGYFELKGVIPGQYKLYISCNNYITPEWYNNKANHAQADLVTVVEGKNTLVEITLGEDSSLKVVSPNGGEVWNVGSSHPITWTNNGPVGNVRLEYSIDNSATWIEIVSSTENIGIYNWLVPIGATPSVNCRVRISEAGDNSPSDVSDAVFTIFANPANWTPVEGLQNNMVVYGKAYNGPNEALAGDWIGAFGPGGISDCRGTSIIGANGSFYFTIGSNAVSGETINFKLWPYPTGPALDADETIEFIVDSIYGGLPLHFGARTQVFAFLSGWNWVGFNTLPVDTSLNAIFGSLAGKIAQVKTQTQAAVYSSGNWIGDLADMSGIANGAMYKINTTQACIFTLNGSTVSYNKLLPMVTGWNWVAYLPVLPQTTAAALNSIMPILLQAKSQTQSAVKLGNGLIGDLTRMESNKGYTIQVNAPGVLIYPIGESTYPDQKADAKLESTLLGTTSVPWKTIQGNQYNMVSYGKVFFEGMAITVPGYYLVSVGPKGEGDCRSISPIGADGSYFSTVLGNTNGEALKFKLYNSVDHKTYSVVESQVFQSDTLKADYNFRARSIRVTAPIEAEQHNMGSICNITWEAYEVNNVKIELYKNGKSLSIIADSLPANTHSFSWTIPVRMRSGNNYQIKISSADPGVIAEDTTANFAILPLAALALNYPVGAEVWQIKRSYDITWGSSGIDNIKIELYKGAALNTVISESTPAAAGKYTWSVPANQILGSDYKIKISSVDVGVNVSDIGKSAFTIAAYKNTSSDFDGDGRADLVWRYYGTGGYNCIWLSGVGQGSAAVNDARLAPQAVIIQDDANLDNEIKGTGDFNNNNDGKEDILWRDKGTGSNSVWFMNGTTFAGSVQIPAETTLSWDICGTGDFNNDGKVDILWRNRANGSNKVWFMNGITRTNEVTLTAEADLNWDIVGAGDFNNDGKPDILWRNVSDGTNRIWIMNGTVFGRTESLSVVNVDWEIVGIGDYDGNGKPDIFWRHRVDGRDLVWIMDGLARVEAINLTRVTNNDWKIGN